MPERLRELKGTAKRLSARLREDHVALGAAGVAFFGFLALIPALAALISLYGLVADPNEAAEHMRELFSTLPRNVSDLLTEQVTTIVESSSGALSVTFVVSILLSLWAASSGMAHLVDATNLVYRVNDERGFVARRGSALLLTVGAVLIAAAGLAVLAVALPTVADHVPGWISWLVDLAGWLLIGLLFVLGLAVLYRSHAQRDDPEFSWVTPGALLAVAAFAAATLALRFYVSNFGSYNETYGSLAAVVVLMLWLFITAFMVLLAGEVNIQLRRDLPRT